MSNELNIRKILDAGVKAINKTPTLKAFLQSYLHGPVPVAEKKPFSAEDYRQMINSPISNVFQRMVYSTVASIKSFEESVREQAILYLHRQEMKELAHEHRGSEHDEGGWFGMDVDRDIPQEQLVVEKIPVKEGLLATALAIILEKLSQSRLSYQAAKHRYKGVLKEYTQVIEDHHREYVDAANNFNLSFSPEQLSHLHQFYQDYHQEKDLKLRPVILETFQQLRPAPMPRRAAELEETHLHRFFNSDQLREMMKRHAADHLMFQSRLTQTVGEVTYYQQATIQLESSLNRQWMMLKMQNRAFELTPKPGSKGAANQEEEVKLSNWPPKLSPYHTDF